MMIRTKTKPRIVIGILIVVVILICGCIGPTDEKPEITDFTVTPEDPITKEPISIHIKATDDKGLQIIGFDVKVTPKKEDFNCNGKRICEHTWYLTAPSKEGTFTVIASAVDSKGQEAEQQKIAQIKTLPTEKCISGDGICPDGCTYEQDNDCEPELSYETNVTKAAETPVIIDSESAIPKASTEKEVEIVFNLEPDMFPESWLSERVNAKATQISENEIARSERILRHSLNKYPEHVLQENLDKVYVIHTLTYFGISAGGTSSSDRVYLAQSKKSVIF